MRNRGQIGHSRSPRGWLSLCGVVDFAALSAKARRHLDKASEFARRHQSLAWGVLGLLLLLGLKRWAYVDMHIARAHHCGEYGWGDFWGTRDVWDAVPINSELDILKVRLHELDSVVDRFVIVEAPYTFSGKKKRFAPPGVRSGRR